MALLTRQRVLAAKIESTPGTYEALAAADATYNVMNPVFTPDIGFNKRAGQSNFSSLAGVTGQRRGKWSFDTDLVGAAASTDPAWATTFMAGCGWLGATHVWKPSTLDPSTLSIGGYQDGRFYLLIGAKGSMKINLKAGEHGIVHFDFEGVLVADADVALLTPTYETTLPPRWASSTCTIGALTPLASVTAFNFQNTIKVAENPATVSGLSRAYITDRSFTMTADPEASLVATYSPQAIMLAHTEVALSYVIGATTGNIITIAAPKAQYTKVEPGDRDGIHVQNIEMQFNRSAALGDDEVSITFS